MKITYLSLSTIPSKKANAVHVMKMCEAFVKCGHKVTLICNFKKSNDAFLLYNIKNRFTIIDIKIKHTKLLFLLRCLISSILSIIKSSDAIYSRDMYASFILSLMNVPHCFEIHNLHNRKFPRLILKIICYKIKGKIIVITPNLAEDLKKEMKVKDGKICIHSDAASPNEFAFKYDNNQKTVLFTGSVYKGKGIETILQIALKIPHIDFIIAGGPEEIWYEKFHDICSKNVKYQGWQNIKSIQKLQSSAGLLLLPNMPDIYTNNGRDNIGRYTSPLKLFEYMASGRPIIASKCDVYMEILNTIKPCAIMVDPYNISEWINEINKLMNNPDYQEQLAKNAYEEFAKHYTWKKRAEAISEYFN